MSPLIHHNCRNRPILFAHHSFQALTLSTEQCRASSSFCDDAGGTLTHIDSRRNMPRMVDVTKKDESVREAVARTRVLLPLSVGAHLDTASGGQTGDFNSSKGPVFATSIIAGTMAVKSTSQLIPFCHPLPVTACDISIMEEAAALEGDLKSYRDTHRCVTVTCTVKVTGKTGVEMEALTGSSVAALCIYDMCKAVSHDIILADTRLLRKRGGKSGDVDVKA